MVAHDAGAARLLFSWLQPLRSQLRCFVQGPARQILDKERPDINPCEHLEACLDRAQLLLSGTGWSSDLEHLARMYAEQRSIPSIAVLDHWVNYQERFVRQSRIALPDGLWVADAEASSLAQRQFPELPVQELPNLWLNQLIKDVSRCRSKQKAQRKQGAAENLLYLLEPLRDHDTGEPNGHEFAALDYWLEQLPGLIADGHIQDDRQTIQLRLRPHPSEDPGKYEAWIRSHCHAWPLQMDPHPSLETSLAHADLTFGCETQALVAAMACGLPAFSTLPPTAPPCRLPHRQLRHLATTNRP